MRAMPCPTAAALVISLAFTGALAGAPGASASPEMPVENNGRHVDMSPRAPLRCPSRAPLVHTAYSPGAGETGAPMVSLRSCFSAADRIGAGYTQFVRNSAVRHPHHRVRG